jgi:hypothetical protein
MLQSCRVQGATGGAVRTANTSAGYRLGVKACTDDRLPTFRDGSVGILEVM